MLHFPTASPNLRHGRGGERGEVCAETVLVLGCHCGCEDGAGVGDDVMRCAVLSRGGWDESGLRNVVGAAQEQLQLQMMHGKLQRFSFNQFDPVSRVNG